MRRCVIVTAYPKRKSLLKSIDFLPDDYIICADGGYHLAREAGMKPQVLIGDFDSWIGGPPEGGCQVYRMPREKDDTDTMLCIKHAINSGFQEIIVLGGIGGRFDHTAANLNSLAYGLDHGANVTIADERNLIAMTECSRLIIPKKEGCKLSLIAYSDQCFQVNISGVKYPLRDALLSSSFPIGVSNEFDGEAAQLSCGKGKLLVILSRD